MKSRRRLFVAAVLGGLLSAGATGQTPQKSANREPPLAAGQGRIYFYRTSTRAPLVRPAVKLNGEAVGSAEPKAAFFVDRNPGDYAIEASTGEKKLWLSLAAGEAMFVRLQVTFGVIGGSVVPELVSRETGRSEMKVLAPASPGAKP